MKTRAQEQVIDTIENLLARYGFDVEDARRWNKRFNQLRNNAKGWTGRYV